MEGGERDRVDHRLVPVHQTTVWLHLTFEEGRRVDKGSHTLVTAQQGGVDFLTYCETEALQTGKKTQHKSSGMSAQRFRYKLWLRRKTYQKRRIAYAPWVIY